MSDLEQRLRAKIKQGKPSQCWPWIGAKSSGSIGYGTISKNGKSVYVHRVAYELSSGEALTSEDCILHTCDCPHCCNPTHLAKGTKGENNADRTAKLRTHSKLTPAQVIAITVRRAAGESAKGLAGSYGVSTSTIYSICRGSTWGHLTGLGRSVQPIAPRPIKSPPRRRRIMIEARHVSSLAQRHHRIVASAA